MFFIKFLNFFKLWPLTSVVNFDLWGLNKFLKSSNSKTILDFFIKPFQQWFSLNCTTFPKNVIWHYSSSFCSFCHSPLLMNVFALVHLSLVLSVLVHGLSVVCASLGSWFACKCILLWGVSVWSKTLSGLRSNTVQ